MHLPVRDRHYFLCIWNRIQFPRSFSIASHHDLTLFPFNSPRTRGRILKRDLSYDLFSREPGQGKREVLFPRNGPPGSNGRLPQPGGTLPPQPTQTRATGYGHRINPKTGDRF